MKNLASPDLTIGALFGLDHMTGLNRVERKEMVPSEEGVRALYLFTCEHLLPEGHRLAIDDRRRIGGIYHEGTILKEIPLNTMQMSVLTALALSFPYPVSQSQLYNLYKIDATHKEKGKRQDLNHEDFINAVHDLGTVCNDIFGDMDISLLSSDDGYQLSRKQGT